MKDKERWRNCNRLEKPKEKKENTLDWVLDQKNDTSQKASEITL